MAIALKAQVRKVRTAMKGNKPGEYIVALSSSTHTDKILCQITYSWSFSMTMPDKSALMTFRDTIFLINFRKACIVSCFNCVDALSVVWRGKFWHWLLNIVKQRVR